MPPSNWYQQNIGSGIGSLWGYSASNMAGGSPYEVRCSLMLVNPGTTRLITPPLNTTGFAALRLSFKHYLSGYDSGCVLKIQTSPDASTWTDEAWSVATTSADIGPETIETVLSHNLNIATTYVAFVITGNLFQYNYWYIDDVSIASAASAKVDFNRDGQEDILWRYYGTGGYNRAWFLQDSSQPALPSSQPASLTDPGLTGISLAQGKAAGRDGRRMNDPRSRSKRTAASKLKDSAEPLKIAIGGDLGVSMIADPRWVGNSAPGSSPSSFNDPREVRIGTPASAPSNAQIRLAGLPAVMGGADVMPVADLNWQIAGTGDFDNDTHVDILWRNIVSGTNVVWLMTGSGWKGSAELIPVTDLSWQIVGTGDFNNDTHVDILWRNASSGENVIWYMNGTTWAGSAVLLGVSDQNWRIVGTGDFNNDTHVDILWRYNGAGGYNVVWYMNNATWTGSAGLISVTDPTWQIAGTGDYDKNGSPDILWRYNGAGGTNVIWYMNGAGWSSSAELLPVADLNWKIVSR